MDWNSCYTLIDKQFSDWSQQHIGFQLEKNEKVVNQIEAKHASDKARQNPLIPWPDIVTFPINQGDT